MIFGSSPEVLKYCYDYGGRWTDLIVQIGLYSVAWCVDGWKYLDVYVRESVSWNVVCHHMRGGAVLISLWSTNKFPCTWLPSVIFPMFLYSKPGHKLETESLKQQQQEIPCLPGCGGEATSQGWRRQTIRKRGGLKTQCVLGEGGFRENRSSRVDFTSRADRAGWSSHLEQI